MRMLCRVLVLSEDRFYCTARVVSRVGCEEVMIAR